MIRANGNKPGVVGFTRRGKFCLLATDVTGRPFDFSSLLNCRFEVGIPTSKVAGEEDQRPRTAVG
jgi:hypothetical protein